MGHFLRDQHIVNVAITEQNLIQLTGLFLERVELHNNLIAAEDVENKTAFLTYIIRFDNKGYRVFGVDDLLKYFQNAKSVERVRFTVQTRESLLSNGSIGTVLELALDEKDPQSSFITVTSDDRDWVDASFAAILEGLTKSKNKNGWVRSAWTAFGVQIIGVTLGFLLSLWAASKIAPNLVIENAFMLTFLFVLLIFSNSWTYLNQLFLKLLNYAFPNVKFLRTGKERLHWLMQAIVGGIVAAALLTVFSQAITFLTDILTNLVSKPR